MNKAKRMKWTNVLLFLSAAIQAATGAALLFNLLRNHTNLLMLALEIHEWNGPVLALLIVFHISLNWEWVRSQLCNKTAATPAKSRHAIRQPL